jgi:hypothetical protein
MSGHVVLGVGAVCHVLELMYLNCGRECVQLYICCPCMIAKRYNGIIFTLPISLSTKVPHFNFKFIAIKVLKQDHAYHLSSETDGGGSDILWFVPASAAGALY